MTDDLKEQAREAEANRTPDVNVDQRTDAEKVKSVVPSDVKTTPQAGGNAEGQRKVDGAL